MSGAKARLPKRIARRRTAGWRMPSNAVYVGRPAIFGNPFRTATAFRRWLIEDYIIEPGHDWDVLDRRRADIFASLGKLTGRDLVCWCREGDPCHADTLLELANITNFR